VSDSVSLADSDRMPRASAGTKRRTTRPLSDHAERVVLSSAGVMGRKARR
jgi:hypothetical protein